MNARRAKARRRLSAPEKEPVSPAAHPLGEAVGVFSIWQENMKKTLLQIMEENRNALLQCTRGPGCPSSVHDPSCLSVR